MRVKAAAILLTLFVSSVSFPAYADPTTTNNNPGVPAIDPSVPAFYSLGVCEDSEQLDCIQSVFVKGESGDFIVSTPLGTQSWIEEIDNEGNTVHTSNSDWTTNIEWTIPQLDPNTFFLNASVHTPSFLAPDGGIRGRLDVGAASLPMGYSVKVAVRTSWIKPQNLQFISEDSSYTQEPISGVDGAYLWTFTGTHARVATYTQEYKWEKTMQDPMDWSEPADEDSYWLDFTIHHAGVNPETSWWDPRCSDHGFTAQAFNSQAAGSPEWNYETGSLEFNIFAPHFDGSGLNVVNQGFFRLWIHEEFAECQWPDNTLVGAEALEVLILNEDGTEQNANTIITNEGGTIYLEAIDFHYSVPTFVIRPRSATPPTVERESNAQPASQISPATITNPALVDSTQTPAPSKASELEDPNPVVAAPFSDAPGSENSGILALMAIVALVIPTVVTLEILRRRRSMPLGRRRI